MSMSGWASLSRGHSRGFPFLLAVLCWLPVAARTTAQSADSDAAREKWQRIPELMQAAGIHAGAVVADVGAGSGFLTIRLAAAVGPNGKVYAVDVSPDALKSLRAKVEGQHLTNVEVIEGAGDDPRLPAGALDAIVMINAYHEIAAPQPVLARLREALRPGGRLALCEPRPKTAGGARDEQVTHHVLEPRYIVGELVQAGFEIVTTDESFAANPSGPDSPYPYSLVVARKR
jgi:ubiquinone/menaquinone biosynthesis C-methylase UbiE